VRLRLPDAADARRRAARHDRDPPHRGRPVPGPAGPLVLPNTSLDGFSGLFKALFEKDYAVVLQNERGSEWSEGQFGFLAGTTADGQDTLDWIARQEWSNGRVGMHGCSSTAENQLKLAAIGHPALRACVPMSSGAGIGDIPGAEGGQGLFYRGGVPMLGTWALWHGPYGVRHRPKLPDVADGELNRIMRRYSTSVPNFRDADYAAALAKSLAEPPSGEVLRRMGSPLTGLEEFIASPTDPSWDSVDLIDASHTGATPSINVNGWLDVGAYETVKLFEFQQHHPDQYLIMAPTGHCQMTRTAKDAKLGDRPVGDTTFDYDEIFTAWFDRWLRDEPDAWKPMPKVRVFLMGAGTWLTGETWPLPDTRERSLYLSSDAGALTLWGDGALRQERARRAPTSSARTRATPSLRSAVTWARAARSSPTSGPWSAGPTSSSTAHKRLSSPSPSPATCAPSCTCRPTGRMPTSSSSSSTCTRTAPRTTSRRRHCGCGTATASRTRRAWSPAGSTGSSCAGSPRRTTSRPVTRSGSRSPGPASPTPTATGTPAAATTWRATDRSRV